MKKLERPVEGETRRREQAPHRLDLDPQTGR